MMRSCNGSVTRLVTITSALLYLGGCAVVTETSVRVDDFIVDGNNISFIISRANNHVTRAADYYAAKTVSARSELYDFSVDFNVHEVTALPVIDEDATMWTPEGVYSPLPTRAIYIASAKKMIHAFDKRMQIRTEAIPRNSVGVYWLRSGRHAYAYMSANSTLTYVSESGESCDVKTQHSFPEATPLFSGNGLFTAIADRPWDRNDSSGTNATIDVYEKCNNITAHHVAMRAQERIRDICRSGNSYWYAVMDSDSLDIRAVKIGTGDRFLLPSHAYSDKYLHQDPRFDCKKNRFVWITIPESQDSKHTHAVLHQFDPATSKKQSVNLLLGKAM